MYTDSQKVGWLEGIIEAVHDGILVIDRNGVVRLINEEYSKITGVEKDQIIGRPLIEVRPGALLPSVLRDGKTREGIFRKEKSKEYVVDMAPICSQNEIIGAVSICKSISEVYELTKELKRSKTRLKQLEKAFGNLHQAKYTFSNIVGNNESLKKVVDQAKKVAASDLNVFITGESGTGKELFAQAIHNESKRRNDPFVPINCAAIPSSLLESELFGYEEGAFTNSKDGGKIGLFELANHGTLFLDEIGDMPLNLQGKLLRVLQEGTFRKIGGLTEQKVDVRIIAATNKNLLNMIQKNHFREDLFYRINAVHLRIPPLRERKNDISSIILSIFEKQNWKLPIISQDVMQILQAYDWPGNIRELKNAIHYAVNMSQQNEIRFDHLPETIKKQFSNNQTQKASSLSLDHLIRETERKAIMNALKITGLSVEGKKKAATLLGISLASLYNKMKKLNIAP